MKKASSISGRALVDKIVAFAEEKKAERVAVLDLRQAGTVADWFVICETDNAAHSRAVFESITGGLHEQGMQPWHIEGVVEGRWILIDFVDVVVHIMMRELREYYDLENLWSQRPPREEKA